MLGIWSSNISGNTSQIGPKIYFSKGLENFIHVWICISPSIKNYCFKFLLSKFKVENHNGEENDYTFLLINIDCVVFSSHD